MCNLVFGFFTRAFERCGRFGAGGCGDRFLGARASAVCVKCQMGWAQVASGRTGVYEFILFRVNSRLASPCPICSRLASPPLFCSRLASPLFSHSERLLSLSLEHFTYRNTERTTSHTHTHTVSLFTTTIHVYSQIKARFFAIKRTKPTKVP